MKKFISIMLILSTLLSLTIICNATLIEEELIDIPAEEEIMPMCSSGCGFGNVKILTNCEINHYIINMHVERGGSGPNIHIKCNGDTYYYNFDTDQFLTRDGATLPGSLIGHPTIESALQRAMHYYNEWS